MRIIDAYILLHNKWHLKCTSTFPSAVWRASDRANYGLVGRHNQNKGISWLPRSKYSYKFVLWEKVWKIFHFLRLLYYIIQPDLKKNRKIQNNQSVLIYNYFIFLIFCENSFFFISTCEKRCESIFRVTNSVSNHTYYLVVNKSFLYHVEKILHIQKYKISKKCTYCQRV